MLKFSPSEKAPRALVNAARTLACSDFRGEATHDIALSSMCEHGGTSQPNGLSPHTAIVDSRAAPLKRGCSSASNFPTMALLNILHYPDKRLHKIAKPVATVDERIRKLVADMAETMYAAPGVGLAATQVDVHERVIVIDVSETHDELRAFINPEIVWSSDERKLAEEGCLSVPGIYDSVERAEKVRVRALNERGETFEIDCEGLLAVCIQHEMDHLMGRVFVEYLSPLKQTRIKTKMKKLAHAM
jgi:peptide deformylase